MYICIYVCKYICLYIYIYLSLSLFFYVGYKLTGRFGKLLLAHSFPTKPSAGAALFGGDEAGWGGEVLAARPPFLESMPS